MESVKIYTSPTCGYCTQAKAYLKEQGVGFIERDVSSDSQAQAELRSYNTTGVPVIVYGKEVIVGFDKVRLDVLFGKLVIECPQCRQKLRLPRNKGVLQVTCKSCAKVFRVNSGEAQ